MENTISSPAGATPQIDSATTSTHNAVTKATPTPASTPATEEKKLSGAELKKQQKAEKAAKRAKAKAESGASRPPPAAPKAPKKDQQQVPKGASAKGGAITTAAASKPQSTLPSRTRRLSTTAPPIKPAPVKQVSLFGHLYGHPRRYGIEGATKEVHPAILALGLQMSNYEVCGSTARCVAMLLAFKSVGSITLPRMQLKFTIP
jgi:translation initiation factor eIF-2B subunit delta